MHKKGGLLNVQQPNFSRNQQTFQDHFLIQSSTFLEINKLFRITLWSKTQLFVNIHFRITLHGPTFKTSIQNLVFQVCRDEVVGWLLPPITSPGRRGPKSEPRAFKELSQNFERIENAQLLSSCPQFRQITSLLMQIVAASCF